MIHFGLSQVKKVLKGLTNQMVHHGRLSPSLSLSCRCIWAGRRCVLRVSTSSCWVAGTETASCAHPSPTSTPFSRRTPWTWCKRENQWKATTLKRGKRLVRLCIPATAGRCGGGAARQRQMRRVARFYICTFWVDGAETPLVRFISTSDPDPKGKTNPSFR